MNKRPPLRRSAPVEQENDGIIEGRNAVIEALRAGVAIDKIFLARGETDSALGHIASAAREQGIVVVDADRRKLDGMSRTHAHQGVIAIAAVRAYASVDDILSAARERGENPLIVVCDELSDPHNLGAVIRTADAAGAHGVIIPKRRSAGLTATVGKTSAGAVAHVPVARVPNLPALLKELKEAGVWVFGAAMDGATPLYQADLKGHRHRHRQRGGGHGPSGGGELRLHRLHPHVRQNQLPQRLRRRRRAAVRGGQAADGLNPRISSAPHR